MVRTMTKQIYSACITKSGAYWNIDLGNIGHTSTKKAGEIDLVSRDYVSLQLNLKPFDFNLAFEFPGEEPENFGLTRFENFLIFINRFLRIS